MVSLYGDMRNAQLNATKDQPEPPVKAALREALAANLAQYGMKGRDNLKECADTLVDANRAIDALKESKVLAHAIELETGRMKATQDAGIARLQFSQVLQEAGKDKKAKFFYEQGLDKLGIPHFDPEPEERDKAFRYNLA
jgi:hypothetical protein